MTRLLLVAAALVVWIAAAGVGAGAEWHVYQCGSIQDAINASYPGDTIYVHAGEYCENVDVNKRLTLEGEGTDVVTVTAASSIDHVFEVTADWVNISGFTVRMEGSANGIWLDNVEHCNISDNNASSNNNSGICLHSSSDNTVTNNTASNNRKGIWVRDYSSNNIIANNIANSNNDHGIQLGGSNNNTLTNNNASNNNHGIWVSGYSSNNTIANNIANSNNNQGIVLAFSSDNTLQGNIANSNSRSGIYLYGSSNNNITCNWMQTNIFSGFCLHRSVDYECTGNNISYNNFIENGNYNTTSGGWEWQFDNCQSNSVNSVKAKHNYWGTGMNNSTIDASILDDDEYAYGGVVDFYPFEINPVTCGTTDTTPPTLTIISPTPNTTTHTSTITIAGTASDASGIASVTVNGEPANGTLDWSANVTLSEGENTIPVVATDGEGLKTTKTVTVSRSEPFTFVHITDVHLGFTFLDIEIDDRTETFTESIEKFIDTLQAVKTHNPEFILSPGDLVEYSKEDFFNAYMGVSKSLDIPLYNTPGNHDRRGWDPREDVGLTTYDEIIKKSRRY